MKNKWMNYIVVIIAILAGVVYCIYLQNYNMDFFKSIYKHMLSIYQQKISGEIIFELIFEYVKKMCIVFVMASFGSLMPLGVIVIAIIVFSYSFSISCFVVLYGIKGVLAAFLLYGIQSMIVIVWSFYILSYGKRVENMERSKIYMVGIDILGLGIVVGLDLVGILNFHTIGQLLI